MSSKNQGLRGPGLLPELGEGGGSSCTQARPLGGTQGAAGDAVTISRSQQLLDKLTGSLLASEGPDPGNVLVVLVFQEAHHGLLQLLRGQRPGRELAVDVDLGLLPFR